MIYIPWTRKKLERRSNQQLCKRCGLFFSKAESECPKCKDVDDRELEILLEKRSSERLGLGNGMLWSSIAVAAILILAIVIIGT